MRLKNKTIASLLILTMLVGLFPNVLGGQQVTVSANGQFAQYAYYFGGGAGTESDPFLIKTEQQLKNVNRVFGEPVYFKLDNDIEISSGWRKIERLSNNASVWTFHFDGDHHTISNLSESTLASNASQAIFDTIYADQEIKNLNIELGNITVDNGRLFSGLALNNYGTVKNVHVSKMNVDDTITLGYVQNTAGLIGSNFGTIENSSTDLNVATAFTSEYSFVSYGGLVNWNDGVINNSYSSGEITTELVELNNELVGIAGGNIGGLVSQNQNNAIISNSYSDVMIDIMFRYDGNNIGGLVGANNAKINNSYSEGQLNVVNASNVGGLVGSNHKRIYGSYSTSNIIGKNLRNVGGLVGEQAYDYFIHHDLKTLYSYALGNISIIEEGHIRELESYYSLGYIGGLVGSLKEGSIDHSYSLGDITYDSRYGGRILGGFVGGINDFGQNLVSISKSYATGQVTSIIESDNEANYSTGFIGRNSTYNQANESFNDNYYLASMTYPSEPTIDGRKIGAEGLNLAEMQDPASFKNWDFDTIWKIDPGNNDGFPTFKSSASFIDINVIAEEDGRVNLYPGFDISYKAEVKTVSGTTETANDLEWSITDTNDAPITEGISVDSTGKVTATADAVPGDYKLTAASPSRGISNGIILTIYPPEVYSFEITHDIPYINYSNTAAKGGSYQLGINVTSGVGNPANTVTWRITGSNSGKLSIDSNNVLTIADDATAGTYWIYARSTVTPTAYEQRINITVVEPYLQFGALSITGNDGHLIQGKESTFTLPITARGNISTTDIGLVVSQSYNMSNPITDAITLDGDKLVVSDLVECYDKNAVAKHPHMN